MQFNLGVKVPRSRDFNYRQIFLVMNPGLPWLHDTKKKQILRVMKLTVFLLFIACLQVSAAAYSQQINLAEKDAPVARVLQQIQEQSGYNFFYNSKAVGEAGTISITLKNATVEEALNELFKNRPFTYSIENKTIVVKQVEPSFLDKIRSALNIAVTVSGRVTNELGEPLPGVTVRQKGTTNAVVTDDKGAYSITVPDNNAVITFSFIGFETKEIVSNSPVTNIILKHSDSKLDEVHIIAYGTTTERLNVGSVGSVSQKQIEQQPVTNPLDAIEGRVAGIFVQATNGLPGGNTSVRIRGQNSITAGLDPLYIVDGIPYPSTPLNTSMNPNLINANGPVSPLNSIPPDDIASIDILKDADATTIYGSRGSNGVIIITTKQGKAGKTHLNINLNQGYTSVAKYDDYLSLQQYLTLVKEGFKNDGVTPSIDPSSPNYAPYLTVWDTTKSTNWQKYLMGGLDKTTQVNANITGGDANTNFVVGGNFRKEGSVLPGDQSYRRSGFYFNLQHHYGRFFASINSSYTFDKNNLTASPNVGAISTFAPDYPIYNADGSLNWFLPTNPVAFLNQKATQQSQNLILNGLLKYNIFPGLDIKSNVGYTKLNADFMATSPLSSQNPDFGPISFADFGSNYIETFVVEPQLEYSKTFSKNKLNILLGSTYQESSTKGWSVEGQNYANDDFLSNLSYAGTIANPQNNFTQYKYFSMFGRLNWINSEKYILDITARRDGSSKFGPSKEYGNFGSVGAGWIFSEEKIVKNNLNFLSFGKLKASYGITGNDQIAPYQYISTYNINTNYNSQSTLKPNRVANENYQWETNKKAEIGLDLGFFNDRIYIQSDIYLNRINNLLVGYPIPYLSGPFGSYVANFPGLIENKGLEITLSSKNIKSKTFQWQTNFNITIPKNKLVSYPNIEASPYANMYVVGQDLSIIKGYKFTGVNPQTGLAQFLDVNNDGNITNPQDQVVIGKTSPDYFGGLSNDFSFKNFQLNVFFQYSHQQAFSNGYATIIPVAFGGNSYTSTLNRWQIPGQIANIQQVTQIYGTPASTAVNYLYNSSAAIVNSSYLRLKNVSLSYNLPERILKSANISQAKVYVQGQNLFVLSKYKYGDPETLAGNTVPIPVLKSIVFGLQLSL